LSLGGTLIFFGNLWGKINTIGSFGDLDNDVVV
jgi:hypothetical protein